LAVAKLRWCRHNSGVFLNPLLDVENRLLLCRMAEDILKNWEKISAGNQKKYRQFLQRANKNQVLDALPGLHEEAISKINCLHCANCCKNYSPRFKTPDIKRISRFLKMRESDFIDKYLSVDEDGDFVVNTKPCPFLGADNFCTIYEERPSDCRRFPYTDEDVIIKRKELTLKNSIFCPITYYVLEKLSEKIK
jgi:Fe-S-cluster containining protein